MSLTTTPSPEVMAATPIILKQYSRRPLDNAVAIAGLSDTYNMLPDNDALVFPLEQPCDLFAVVTDACTKLLQLFS